MLLKLSTFPRACQVAAFSLLVKFVVFLLRLLADTTAQHHDYTGIVTDEDEDTSNHLTLFRLCETVLADTFPSQVPDLCATALQQFLWFAFEILSRAKNRKKVFILLFGKQRLHIHVFL